MAAATRGDLRSGKLETGELGGRSPPRAQRAREELCRWRVPQGLGVGPGADLDLGSHDRDRPGADGPRTRANGPQMRSGRRAP